MNQQEKTCFTENLKSGCAFTVINYAKPLHPSSLHPSGISAIVKMYAGMNEVVERKRDFKFNVLLQHYWLPRRYRVMMRVALVSACMIDNSESITVQYRYLIPAPVDRTSASAWLYTHQWIICQNNNPNTSMTHVACESILRSVARSSMHLWPANWVAIGRAVVYYARASQEFSLGMKCWHCTSERLQLMIIQWKFQFRCYCSMFLFFFILFLHLSK